VYSTSDAAWTADDERSAAQARRADDGDDTGDTDGPGAAAGDRMTDDADGTAPAAVTTSTSTTARGGRGKRPVRVQRPQGAAGAGREAQRGSDTSAPPARTAPEQEPAPRKSAVQKPAAPKRPTPQQPVVLRAEGIVKRYGQTLAVDDVDLEIRTGSIFGVVGPNGAGKTTTLSILTGLLRPDAGSVTVLDRDVWSDPTAAKRSIGVLPDRLRLFDRLTGAQMLFYSATLHGLDGATARSRSADLARAFGLGDALGRQVADYSVGMAKKIALAATLIHSPRVLVLDEPFESVDPVSATTITDVLRRYTAGGGTVVLSSHSMELVQRTCDSVAIIVGGKVLAAGTMAQVRGRRSLEDTFVELAGGRVVAESMEWLHSFSG